MNIHIDAKNITDVVSIGLRTEISTIFLTVNNLLEIADASVVYKYINKFVFFSTFFYYRIYNYLYHLMFDKNIHTLIFAYSKNNFYFWELYISIYGLFVLNLYWSTIIFKKILYKNVYNYIHNHIKLGEKHTE
jgi:hypothetical protein